MDLEIMLTALLGFLVLGAVVAVETRNLLSSVISLGAVGFGLSIAFLILRAPDLALVQIAVEVLLLIFLIRATIRRDVIPEGGHIHWAGLLGVVVLCLGLLAFGTVALRQLGAVGTPIFAAKPDAPSNTYLAQGVKETGAVNIVTAVLLDYRAYDTLGEATVLFTAVIGALAILRGVARRSGTEDGRPAPPKEADR